jgi:hypothetical protein
LGNGTTSNSSAAVSVLEPPVPLSSPTSVAATATNATAKSIDVSWNAIQSGMLATFASSLKHYLYSGQFNLAQGIKVGFLTFDKTLHFIKNAIISFH